MGEGKAGAPSTDTFMRKLRPGDYEVVESCALCKLWKTMPKKCPIPNDLHRRLNPGVNQITASVRAAYGTAHQVRIKPQHWILLKVEMSSSKHQVKKRLANEVVEVYLQSIINF